MRSAVLETQLPKANRPFNLLVFQFWSFFSKGPKRLTLYFWVVWATEERFGVVFEAQAVSRGGFAAILESGVVVTWGHPELGGNSSHAQEQLRNVQVRERWFGLLA